MKKRNVSAKKLTLEIMKNCKLEVFLKFLISIITRGLLLITPFLYSAAINNIPLGYYGKAISYLLFALILTILYYVLSHVNNISYYNLYDKIYRNYNWEIIKSTQHNSAYSLSRFSLGEYSNYMSQDIGIIADFLDTSIIRIVKMFEFIVIYCYFYTISKTVFLISILVSLLALLINIIRGSKTERLNSKRKKELDNYISTVNDTFLGMKEIKSLHIIDKVKDRIITSNDVFLENSRKYNMYYQKINYLILAIIEMFRYGLIIYGVYLVSIGQFEIGTIVLIYNYYSKMIENFSDINTMNVDFRNFKVSLKRIDRLFEYSEKNIDIDVKTKSITMGKIEFKNVLYGNKNNPILRKASFEIEPNSIAVITGKIGSGKSGIFDLLMRINRQHEGIIAINGMDIREITDDLYYNLIAIARKTPTFFNISIIDNLKLLTDDEKIIKNICVKMNIDKPIKALSKGYDTDINAREVNTELKQMLGIARVFIKDPSIMLFDEIIDTLDDDNRDIVLNILQELKKDHTLVLISRTPDILSVGDKVITIERNTVKKIDEKK